MTMFRLKRLPTMNDEILKEIANSPKLLNLTHLDFSGNYNITEFGVQIIANDIKMRTLTDLNFSDCVQLTNNSITFLSESQNFISLKFFISD